MHVNPTVLIYLADTRLADDHRAQRARPIALQQTPPIAPFSRRQMLVNVHYIRQAFARLLPFTA